MAKILKKSTLAPQVYEFIVDAPLVAHKCQPGQFVIIRTEEESERIPLTIADFDREQGTITIIVQAVGNTTKHLCEAFNENDEILDVVGPLGMPSHIENFGTVVCVGGGIGVAPVYPIARALKEAGNKVISIIGARNKDLIIFKDKIAKKVFNILKDKYDVYVNPTGGDREEYVLRVAHIGDTTIEDNKMLIDLLRKAIKEAKS